MSIINAYTYNLRTRSLNNVCLQLIMVPSPLILAAIMDTSLIKSRKQRGIVGVLVMAAVTVATWSATAAWIVENNVDRTPLGRDWTDERFGPGFAVYLFQGVVYGVSVPPFPPPPFEIGSVKDGSMGTPELTNNQKTYQIAVQWVLSALTNDPDTCSRYAGLFKGTTGLGLCISFLLDAAEVSFVNQMIVQFVLYVFGILVLLLIIVTQVRETNYFLEDSVIVPHRFEEKLLAEGAVTEEQAANERRKGELAAQLDEKDSENEVAVEELKV